jgi:hypothetical protein
LSGIEWKQVGYCGELWQIVGNFGSLQGILACKREEKEAWRY